MKNNTIIIGYGEIGKSLHAILKKKYEVHIRDIGDGTSLSSVHVMHICFPYTKKFVSEVKRYKKKYNPKYIVIHSTVPMGTSRKCGAYYSPVRGIHPHLEKSLKIFVKYMAPKNNELASYFTSIGVKIEQHDSTDTLEVMKLYCTTLYGLNIIAEKEIWDYCKKYKLDYNLIYTKANKTYNEGYKKLGFPQFSKYELIHKDGKIGGHCVVPNCKLLNTSIANFVKKQNKKL